MALIDCPECGKRISESTPACPHCGYVLSTAASSAPVSQPTKIGNTQVNYQTGIALVLIGCIGLVGSFFALMMFFPFGVVAFIGSIAVLGLGMSKMSGMQEVYCPYCGRLGSISKSAGNYRCPSCKKRSIRDGEYLKPVI